MRNVVRPSLTVVTCGPVAYAARSEQAEAALLLTAADRTDRDAQTEQRDVAEDTGLGAYDSAERRERCRRLLETDRRLGGCVVGGCP